MAEPIVFVSHFTVREGTLNELKQQFREVLEVLEAEKTRTTAQLAFLDETATKLSIVHVFADAESMDIHVQGAEERAKAAYEFMAPAGWEIYGTPSDAALQMMRQAATSAGVALTIQPEYMGGFLRVKSA
jgi:quinol monooxygenase YgiN